MKKNNIHRQNIRRILKTNRKRFDGFFLYLLSGEKIRKDRESPYVRVFCKNCGTVTEYDRCSKCLSPLCRVCALSGNCNECKDREAEQEYERSLYDGDMIG